MSFRSWFTHLQLARTFDGLQRERRRSPRRRPPVRRLQFEALENRSMLTTFFAATAADLVNDIHAANKAQGKNTIVLTAPVTSPYVLTAADNKTDGPTVLPVIKQGDTLTILTGNGSANPGYGDTLNASRFGRLFDVAKGASLTLQNVTLGNGAVAGTGVSAEGGAIFNQGTLVLSEVTVLSNAAQGLYVNAKNTLGAAGGGIWSNFSLTLENNTVISRNVAGGGDARAKTSGAAPGGFGGGIYIAGGIANITGTKFTGNLASVGSSAGLAYGGAVYVAGGTVTLDNVTLGGNQTSPYDDGYGGGLYVAGGNVTLTNDIITQNVAYGGGVGVFIASGPTVNVHIDLFTVANTYQNFADDIEGAYILTV